MIIHLHIHRMTYRKQFSSKTKYLFFIITSVCHIVAACTDQSLIRRWTCHRWGPAGSCLWPSTDGHRMGPLPPASACGCRPSDDTGTGTRRPSAAHREGTLAQRWLLPAPLAPRSFLTIPPLLLGLGQKERDGEAEVITLNLTHLNSSAVELQGLQCLMTEPHRGLSGQYCCSNLHSSNVYWAGLQRSDSRKVVQEGPGCPGWCKCVRVAPSPGCNMWRPCRPHLSHTHSLSSRSLCSYTVELW